MRLHLLLSALLAWSGVASSASAPESSAEAKAAIAESTNAILQGDSHRALAALEAVDDDQYAGFDAQYLACMRARFQRDTPPWLAGGIDDPFVRDVLWSYQDYWWHALAEPSQRAKFETVLLGRLQALLGPTPRLAAADLDGIEPRLSAALEARGWHVQLGVTSPLREMMLWRKTQMRTYEVELPEGRHKVPVALLDDFAALGWSAYGRCDRGSNGGWATEQQPVRDRAGLRRRPRRRGVPRRVPRPRGAAFRRQEPLPRPGRLGVRIPRQAHRTGTGANASAKSACAASSPARATTSTRRIPMPTSAWSPTCASACAASRSMCPSPNCRLPRANCCSKTRAGARSRLQGGNSCRARSWRARRPVTCYRSAGS